MKLQKSYTSLLTMDLPAAEAWYTKLLGRRPDYRPMDTLVQWEFFDQGGLMISNLEEIAGNGAMFLYIAGMAPNKPIEWDGFSATPFGLRSKTAPHGQRYVR